MKIKTEFAPITIKIETDKEASILLDLIKEGAKALVMSDTEQINSIIKYLENAIPREIN